MGVHPIKKFIYHHAITAKMYNVIRTYRRDKRNKLTDEKRTTPLKYWRDEKGNKIICIEAR